MAGAGDDQNLSAAATVTVVAQLVGLSRERFYQLVREGVFPPPERDAKGRPYYTADGQRACIEVRRRGVGANGKAILFNAKKGQQAAAARRARPSGATPDAASPAGQYRWLVDAVNGLGLDARVTEAQVEAAVRACFKSGIGGVSRGDLIRRVFLHLKGTNTCE